MERQQQDRTEGNGTEVRSGKREVRLGKKINAWNEKKEERERSKRLLLVKKKNKILNKLS